MCGCVSECMCLVCVWVCLLQVYVYIRLCMYCPLIVHPFHYCPSHFLSLSSPTPLPPPSSSLLTLPHHHPRRRPAGLHRAVTGRTFLMILQMDVSLLCQLHPHVEHTQWGNIKVATRGAVCGCVGVGVYGGWWKRYKRCSVVNMLGGVP